MSIDMPPNRNLQQTLVPIEHALVTSANIIDKWGSLRGGDKNPFFDCIWDDDENQLKIELQSNMQSSYVEKVEELAGYLASAPVGTAAEDEEFLGIMKLNDIQDPRLRYKLGRYARKVAGM